MVVGGLFLDHSEVTVLEVAKAVAGKARVIHEKLSLMRDAREPLLNTQRDVLPCRIDRATPGERLAQQVLGLETYYILFTLTAPDRFLVGIKE